MLALSLYNGTRNRIINKGTGKQYTNNLKIKVMEINRHIRDFGCDFTIEYNVKNINGEYLLSDEDFDFEMETGTFANKYAKECFNDIQKLGYDWITDWSFTGRSNGWFVLLCEGKDVEKIRQTQFAKIENIINRYLKGYVKRLNSFYCAEKINTLQEIN